MNNKELTNKIIEKISRANKIELIEILKNGIIIDKYGLIDSGEVIVIIRNLANFKKAEDLKNHEQSTNIRKKSN